MTPGGGGVQSGVCGLHAYWSPVISTLPLGNSVALARDRASSRFLQDRTSGRGQLQNPRILLAACRVLGSKPAAVVAVTVRGLAIQIQRGDPIGVWVEVFTFGVEKLGALQEGRLG
jgi:hypothetical protein